MLRMQREKAKTKIIIKKNGINVDHPNPCKTEFATQRRT